MAMDITTSTSVNAVFAVHFPICLESTVIQNVGNVVLPAASRFDYSKGCTIVGKLRHKKAGQGKELGEDEVNGKGREDEADD